METLRYYWTQFWDNPFTTFKNKPDEPDSDHNTVTGRGDDDVR
ncbi:hypothetical protein SEA_FORZA_38 [Gordonia phage Forza]|uniref:Uncharacterized protein n=1 Tax=Gordonia phage Forza TaxID=2571247 RepID=A0A650F0H3_9CAUD|nr:hypothetical protein PP303_gp038 [Gordonia phage Forza]QGT55031.1 hypothetical protein SEA_FORZA_38 [Gordonia phage Forza]